MDLKTYLTTTTQSELVEKINKAADQYGWRSVTQSAISQWLTSRVPVERAIQLEYITDGAITREECRPDVFSQRFLSNPPQDTQTR